MHTFDIVWNNLSPDSRSLHELCQVLSVISSFPSCQVSPGAALLYHLCLLGSPTDLKVVVGEPEHIFAHSPTFLLSIFSPLKLWWSSHQPLGPTAQWIRFSSLSSLSFTPWKAEMPNLKFWIHLQHWFPAHYCPPYCPHYCPPTSSRGGRSRPNRYHLQHLKCYNVDPSVFCSFRWNFWSTIWPPSFQINFFGMTIWPHSVAYTNVGPYNFSTYKKGKEGESLLQ